MIRRLATISAVALLGLLASRSAFATDDFPTCPVTPLDPTGALCASLDGVFDRIPTTADRCTRDPERDYPSHFKGDFTVDGPWTFNKDAIANAYRGVTPDKFGSVDIELPGGKSNNVRDLHYRLGDGKIGVRPIPVSDASEVTTADGHKVKGYQVIDDYLREKMGLKKSDPIFALIAYQHPEENKGDLKKLGTEFVKTENGETHLGAYIGKGATRNSPEGYHNHVWDNKGYPATVQIVSMNGTKQADLNRSFETASAILNKGVVFPTNDYKNDPYKTVDLKTTLAFYEGWLTDDPKLKNDPTWFTYCAEHQTIVTNVGLNVPPNEKAYQAIWGDEKGSKLFALAKDKYKASSGKDMPEADFEPLYKKDGITDPLNETTVGKGLAWAPEATSDIVVNFMETYASFPDVGAATSAATLLGFKDIIKERMGISDADFMKIAMPVISKMFVAEGLMNDFSKVPAAALIKQKTAEAYVAVGGKPEDFAPGGTIDAGKMALAQTLVSGLQGRIGDVAAHSGLCADQAWSWYRKAIAPELAAAHAQAVADGKVQWYSPPAITHRVASGMLPHDPNISITEVATAMDESELTLKAAAPAAPVN